MKSLFHHLIYLFIFVFSLNATALAQTTREKGIELYQQGKFAEAVKVLQPLSKQKETKRDASVWNYLGLSYMESGDLKKARKALEKAVGLEPGSSAFRTNLAYAYISSRRIDAAQTQIGRAIELDPRNVTAYFLRGAARIQEKRYAEALADADRIISIDRDYANAYTLKSNACLYLFGERVAGDVLAVRDEIDSLRKAIEPLEYCVQYCKDNKSLAEQREKLEALQAFYDYFLRRKEAADTPTNTPTVPVTPDADVTPIKILTKPQARYTDKSRRNNISGTITLYVLFAASGRVTFILPVSTLGYGLDQQAVDAARRITFEPQRKNGVPVSVVKKVMYSFTIY